MFGRKNKPNFVEAGPSLSDRLSKLRGRASLGEEPAFSGPRRWARWLLLPWILIAAPLRAIFNALNSLLLRGGQVGATLRSRQVRHLLQGLPAVFAAIAVLVVGGIVLGREDGLHDVYQKAAIDAFDAQDFKKAHLYFERLFELDKGSAETRYYLGLALDQLDRHAEAMHLINGVAEGDAGGDDRANAWVAAKLMSDEERRQDPQIQATIYRNLLKAHRGLPGNLEVKVNLANFHLMTGDYRKAIPYIEEAAAINPVLNIDLAEFYSLDGRSNSAKTALERAETHLRAKLDRKPVDQQTRIALVKASFMQAEYVQVLELLEQGHALDPGGPYPSLMAQTHIALYDRLAAESKRDYRAMLGHLREALRLSPGMRQAIERLVGFGEQTREIPKQVENAAIDPEIEQSAKDMLQTMIARGEQAPWAHMALGLKAWRDDDSETALTHFEAAYNLDPLAAEIANNLAWILTHQDIPRPERALAIINTVLERHPNHRKFRDTRGEVYLALKQWDNAVQDLEFALPALKDEPRIHRSLATAYEARGQGELAETHRREADRLQSLGTPRTPAENAAANDG